MKMTVNLIISDNDKMISMFNHKHRGSCAYNMSTDLPNWIRQLIGLPSDMNEYSQ